MQLLLKLKGSPSSDIGHLMIKGTEPKRKSIVVKKKVNYILLVSGWRKGNHCLDIELIFNMRINGLYYIFEHLMISKNRTELPKVIKEISKGAPAVSSSSSKYRPRLKSLSV